MILCTFPGRNGDLLWALPTIRAISEHFGEPVDLQIGTEFTGIVPLLEKQFYLGKVWADPRWSLTPPNEWQAPHTAGYDRVFHCGYRGWPELPLPFMTLRGVNTDYQRELPTLEINLERPWIEVRPCGIPWPLVVAFTEEWFELKFGVLSLLKRPLIAATIPQSRWDREAVGVRGQQVWVNSMGFLRLAEYMASAEQILCCCSAPHVLAIALGRRVVVYEPSPARHNPIFFPLGMDGRVKVSKGLDGLPTIDVRHLAEALDA